MPDAFCIACDILGDLAGKQAADLWRSVFALRDPSDVLQQFASAGFGAADLRPIGVTARYPSMAAFVNAHVVFLTGRRADADAVLRLARDELERFCTASGAMHMPIEGYIVTAVKA
jgi:hypothetical protein